jgi:hypothetical protein
VLRDKLGAVSEQLQEMQSLNDEKVLAAALDTFKGGHNQLELAKLLVKKQYEPAAQEAAAAAQQQQEVAPEGGIQAAAPAATKASWQEVEVVWPVFAPAAWVFTEFVTNAQQQCCSVQQHAKELQRLVHEQQLGGGAGNAARQWKAEVLYCLGSACFALDEQLGAEKGLDGQLRAQQELQQRRQQQHEQENEQEQEQQEQQQQQAHHEAERAAAEAAQLGILLQQQQARMRAVEEAHARVSSFKDQLKQQQPPWHKLEDMCSLLVAVQPVLTAQWFLAVPAPAATWWMHDDNLSPCPPPMVPSYWAAWQPGFLQYLQQQRQGLSAVLQQQAAQWVPVGGPRRTHWYSQLVDGIAVAGHFLPNLARSSISYFRSQLRQALLTVKPDGSLQRLVQPIVQHWHAGNRAFLAPLAYAFTEVRPHTSATLVTQHSQHV